MELTLESAGVVEAKGKLCCLQILEVLGWRQLRWT